MKPGKYAVFGGGLPAGSVVSWDRNSGRRRMGDFLELLTRRELVGMHSLAGCWRRCRGGSLPACWHVRFVPTADLENSIRWVQIDGTLIDWLIDLLSIAILNRGGRRAARR